MPERVVNMLQAVYVDEKEQHPPVGSMPEFQLTVCKGHKTTAVVQSPQFVGESKIAQLGLKHVLLGGAANCAHQEFIYPPPLGAGRGPLRLFVNLSQQKRQLLNCFRNQNLKNLFNK